jgi:hypothetical protein
MQMQLITFCKPWNALVTKLTWISKPATANIRRTAYVTTWHNCKKAEESIMWQSETGYIDSNCMIVHVSIYLRFSINVNIVVNSKIVVCWFSGWRSSSSCCGRNSDLWFWTERLPPTPATLSAPPSAMECRTSSLRWVPMFVCLFVFLIKTIIQGLICDVSP